MAEPVIITSMKTSGGRVVKCHFTTRGVRTPSKTWTCHGGLPLFFVITKLRPHSESGCAAVSEALKTLRDRMER